MEKRQKWSTGTTLTHYSLAKRLFTYSGASGTTSVNLQELEAHSLVYANLRICVFVY